VDTAFLIAHSLLIALVLGSWAIGVAWVAVDARRRTTDARKIVGAAAIGALLPLVGLVVYLCARPPVTLVERRERELTRRALELELYEGERCLVCRTPLEESFLRCPVCATAVRTPCTSCAAPLELTWSACPYCAVELAGPVLVVLADRGRPAARAERHVRAA
jgi:hypothetical protein